MTIELGDTFKCEMLGEGYTFKATVTVINVNEDKDREFELKLTERVRTDSRGMTYSLSDTYAEVERAWFTANPKRKLSKILF